MEHPPAQGSRAVKRKRNKFEQEHKAGGTLNFMSEAFDSTMPLLPGASL